MMKQALASICLAAATAALTLPTTAHAKPYKLPSEKPLSLPKGQGVELTSATCSACHSLDYLATQPRGKGEQFWKDSVAKMINVYGAPVSKDDASVIAAYLGATFGAAKPAS